MRIAVLGLILSLGLVSPAHAAITPLAWAENTAGCLTDHFGQMGRLVRPAWVEERGVTGAITTERVVLVWTTDSGDEVTTWFDLIWRETGPELVGTQAEGEGMSRYYQSRVARWLMVEGQVGGHTPPLVIGAGADCTSQALDAIWGH
jgi:hypothetical protein